MLKKIFAYLEHHPEANSFQVCEVFGLSRGMGDRVLAMLEDAGVILAEAPSSGCSSGGCSSGGCSSGGCGVKGPAAAINALADAARSKKALMA